MSASVVIFARPDHGVGGWTGLSRYFVTADGKMSEEPDPEATLIVLADVVNPDLLDLDFGSSEKVCGIEHKTRPPSAQHQEKMKNWPNYDPISRFNHVSGNYYFECLRKIIGKEADDRNRALVVSEMTSQSLATSQIQTLNYAAMLFQIMELDPDRDVKGLERYLRRSTYGDELMDEMMFDRSGFASHLQAELDSLPNFG